MVPKSNRKIAETETKQIPLRYAYIHDSSFNWLCTDTSIKSGGVKIVKSPVRGIESTNTCIIFIHQREFIN